MVLKSRRKRWILLTAASSAILLVLLASSGPIARVRGTPPVADFTISSNYILVGQAIQFTFTGSPGSGIVEYSWDPGDGTGILHDPSPVHTYNSPGEFSITLTVKDSDGYLATVTKGALLYVQPYPYRPWPAEPEDDSDALLVFLLAGFVVSAVAGIVATIASIVISYRERRKATRARAQQALEKSRAPRPATAVIGPDASTPVQHA